MHSFTYSPCHLLLIRRLNGGACKLVEPDTLSTLSEYGLLRYRGKRAGSKRIIRQFGSFYSAGNGAYVVTGNGAIVKQVRREDRERVLRPVNRAAVLAPPVNVGEFNACSVSNKSASINHWIADNNLRLAGVMESWHDSLNCPELIACAPPGYHFIERARPRSASSDNSMRINHGGVVLFYHCSLHARRVMFIDYNTFEFVSAYVTGSGLTILVIVIYRPGSAAVSDKFYDEFSDLLERASTYASSLIIIGDLNIHLDIASDSATIKFLDVLDQHSLVQHVTGATHRAGHCLDVLITNRELSVRSVEISPPMLSDHSCIVGRLNLLGQQDHTSVRRQCRSWRAFDYDRFHSDLCQYELVRSPSSLHTVSELFDRYNSTLRSLLDAHAPIKTVCIRTARTAPWYDEDCRREKKQTRLFEKIYRRTKNDHDEKLWREKFEHQRQFFQQKISVYWTQIIDSCRGDSKALWSKLRVQMSPSLPQNSSHFSAEDFAAFFASKVDKIRASTANAPSPEIMTRSVPLSLTSFDVVSLDEVARLLSRTPAKHCSLDPAPTWLVKRASDVLAPVLREMCNASMKSGELPSNQKSAIVFPRLKKPTLDADDTNSYRPISNLSFSSKFVERVVAAQFTGHAERHGLFPPNQSAYRRNHNTETAVISVMNDIILAIDHGKVTALVLLDLSAAFDTVDHTTLLDVLNRRFAVEGTSLLWFKSYLTNRSQSFSVDGVQSKLIDVGYSVPQGSVLGPLEFISYTEDVVAVFSRNCVRHHLFADDKQLYQSGKITEIDIIRNLLSRCIIDVRDWCASRRLQLNASKTELQWFGSRANLRKLATANLTLSVGDDVIQPVTVVRDLGVQLDAELTMKQHISRVVSSCFFQLRRLRQIRRSAGEEVTKRLVIALVLSRLDYCNAALAGLPESTIRPLQRVQNAAARLITNTRQRDSITPVLKRLHWLPVKQRIIYKLCLLMHMIHTQQCPVYMADMVQSTAKTASRPGLRSANHLLYRKPALKSKFGERAFSHAGPAAWNSLPNHIQCDSNTNSFKKQLKTFLFTSAF